MSTLAAPDFRMRAFEVIGCWRIERLRAGHNDSRPGRKPTRDPESAVPTVSAERTAHRSPSTVAEARRATRAFLGTLVHPAIDQEQADTVILIVSEPVPWPRRGSRELRAGQLQPACSQGLPVVIRGSVRLFHRRGSDRPCPASRGPRRRLSRARASSRRRSRSLQALISSARQGQDRGCGPGPAACPLAVGPGQAAAGSGRRSSAWPKRRA